MSPNFPSKKALNPNFIHVNLHQKYDINIKENNPKNSQPTKAVMKSQDIKNKFMHNTKQNIKNTKRTINTSKKK